MNYNFLSVFNIFCGDKYKYFIKTKIIIKSNEKKYEILYIKLNDVISECEALDIKKIGNKFNPDYYSLAIYVFQILQKYINSNKGENKENIKKAERKLRENYLVKYQINLLPFRFYEVKFINNDFMKNENKNLVYFSRLNYYKKNKKVISNRKTIKNLEQLLCILRHD